MIVSSVTDRARRRIDSLLESIQGLPLPLFLSKILSELAVAYTELEAIKSSISIENKDLVLEFIKAVRKGDEELIEASFKRLLTGFDVKNEDPWEHRKIWPTMLDYCEIKNGIMIAKGIRPEPNTRMIRGKLYHRALASIFFGTLPVEVPIRIPLEDPGYEDWKISGRIDLIVLDPKTVVEFKLTTRPESVEHYRMQTIAYLGALKAERAFIIATHPETFDVKVHRIDYNSADFGFCIEKAKRIIEIARLYRESEEVPQMAYGPEYSWECRKCPVKELCPLR